MKRTHDKWETVTLKLGDVPLYISCPARQQQPPLPDPLRSFGRISAIGRGTPIYDSYVMVLGASARRRFSRGRRF